MTHKMIAKVLNEEQETKNLILKNKAMYRECVVLVMSIPMVCVVLLQRTVSRGHTTADRHTSQSSAGTSCTTLQ